jgi:N-acetylglucosamine-6-sulfatase
MAGLLIAALRAVAAPPPPNVVLIMTDDQTVRDIAVMPRTRAAIGGQGVTFTDYRASYPMCCPARAAMLTGQYAHNHRVLGNFSPHGGIARLDQRYTVPVALSARPDADYVTAYVGKYLNGYGHKPFSGVPPGWRNWHGALTAYRMYGYSLNENGQVRKFGDIYTENPRFYQTTVYRRIANRFIRGRAHANDGRPFFLSVAFLAPHAEIYDRKGRPPPSIRAAPRDRGRFASRLLPRGPAFDEADISDKPRWLRRERRNRLTPAQIRAITRRHRARSESLLAVDRAVEVIVDTLRDTGQLRGT